MSFVFESVSLTGKFKPLAFFFIKLRQIRYALEVEKFKEFLCGSVCDGLSGDVLFSDFLYKLSISALVMGWL